METEPPTVPTGYGGNATPGRMGGVIAPILRPPDAAPVQSATAPPTSGAKPAPRQKLPEKPSRGYNPGMNINGYSNRLTIKDRFTDVSARDWFYIDVNFVNTNGLFKGFSDTLFEPNMPMTRAMTVTVLYRTNGSPEIKDMLNPFYDVPAGEYYYDAVLWAASNGIVYGFPDGSFMPEDNITRQQLAAIIYRYAAFTGNPFPEDPQAAAPELLNSALNEWYSDAADIDDYARAPALALAKKGIMLGGLGYMFNPRDNGTRAQTAAILRRYLTVPPG